MCISIFLYVKSTNSSIAFILPHTLHLGILNDVGMPDLILSEVHTSQNSPINATSSDDLGHVGQYFIIANTSRFKCGIINWNQLDSCRLTMAPYAGLVIMTPMRAPIIADSENPTTCVRDVEKNSGSMAIIIRSASVHTI